MFTFSGFVITTFFLLSGCASPIVKQGDSGQDAHSFSRTTRTPFQLPNTNQFLEFRNHSRPINVVSLQPIPLSDNQKGYPESGEIGIKLLKRISLRQTDSNDSDTESGGSTIGSDIEGILERVESCFPGNAAVKVEHTGWVPMKELRIGDRVLQANGAYSAVFGFSHRLRTSRHPFRRICTSMHCVSASHGHYMFTKQKLVAAGSIEAGDFLATGVDKYEEVISSEDVWEQGLYNPHTLTGELVVEGFRASCYTTAVRPDIAKTLLSPLRAAFRLIDADVSAGMLAYARHPKMFRSAMLGQSSLAL